MGNFYVNYTIRTTNHAKVINALAGRNAFVTPPRNGAVVVFDETSDSQDQDLVRELGKKLSRELGEAVLAVLNHDDDIFWYALFKKGKCTDEYDSSPGYFDPESNPQSPSGGNAAKLCTAFGSPNIQETEKILRKSSYEDDGYTFAVERHADLVKELNLPDFAVGFGFTYIAQGELPPGLAQNDLTKITQ